MFPISVETIMPALVIAPKAMRLSVAAIVLLLATRIATAEIPPTADLPPIFNGKDLTGWKVVGEPYWKVVDGAIIGANDTDMKGSMLYTEKSYGDVIVEGEVRFNGRIGAGVR